ncbi:MAG: SOS response-associated peptidase [candidate division Zixibacteria bacterium]|nr:SOS response-associated peptidase [candidate division Zixibacteria bacterium]
MCGRFTFTIAEAQARKIFEAELGEIRVSPRYNIAPTQYIPVIAPDEEGTPVLTQMKWGLIPAWAPDESIGTRMINARSETISEKRTFKAALVKRRCLIPADGFYEWVKKGKEKIPLRITLKDEKPFAFAGLWDRWKNPRGEEIKSCTIITCAANNFMKKYHQRMPVILKPKERKLWLDMGVTDLEKLAGVLVQYPASQMRAYLVSSLVNSPRNDTPECIKALK